MTTTLVTNSRIARHLDSVPAAIRDTLRACAEESVRLMLANGWDPSGGTYEIGAMPGDRQAAEDAIGRELGRHEVRALELVIRELLAAAVTAPDITDEQIEALRAESRDHGDEVQVLLCNKALDGDEAARAECAQVIRNAQAMVDS